MTFVGYNVHQRVAVAARWWARERTHSFGAFLADIQNPRRWTVLVSGLLCGLLAVVVLYTNRGRLSSPLSIVVLAAVGLLALILQMRLPGQIKQRRVSSPPWLNGIGVTCALAALAVDITRFHAEYANALALIAAACFAVSSAIVLQALRKVN